MTSFSATTRCEGLSAWRVRLIGLFIALFCGTPLVIAVTLHPSSTGEGTHEQLGLPPCSTLMYTGWPCPTCGWTTTFTWTMHGRPDKALLVQPAGALLSFVFIAALLGGLYMLWTGRNMLPLAGRWMNRRTMFWAVLIVLASWAYKAALVKGWM